MSGLVSPRGLAIGPSGGLYVAEAGNGGDGPSVVLGTGDEAFYGRTGGVSRLLNGVQQRVLTDLPSIAAMNPFLGVEAMGLNDIAFDDSGTLYGVMGLATDPAMRADLGAPGADFATLVRLSLDGSPFEQIADLGAYEVVNNPDGGLPDSNPFGLAVAPDGSFLVADAGANDLLRIAADGTVSTLDVLPNQSNPLPSGPPTFQAVPTAIEVGPDGAYYAGQLTGFPFAPGAANVYRFDPVSEELAVAYSGFTNITDLTFDDEGNLYVLQLTTNGLTSSKGPGPGALIKIDTATGDRTTIASDGLTFPGSVIAGPEGTLYVTNRITSAEGQVLSVSLIPEPSTLLLGLACAAIAVFRIAQNRPASGCMRAILLLSAATLALSAGQIQAQPIDIIQAPFGPGGTYNLYEFVTTPLQWWEANEDAAHRMRGGVGGHLVDIVSADENSFLSGRGAGGEWWIGLTDREGMAPPVINGGLPAPQESQTLDRRSQGWAWTSGVPLVYQNFDSDQTPQPNDFRGGEDAVHIFGAGEWNDHKSGLSANAPTVPSLQPGTSTDESDGPRFNYIVEYPTQSVDPVPGFDVFGPRRFTLSNGIDSKGGMSIETDPFGASGSATFEGSSWGFLQTLMLADEENFQWLMDANEWPLELENLTDISALKSDTANDNERMRTSTFVISDDSLSSLPAELSVSVTQETPSTGYNFVQQYAFTNTGGTPVELKAVLLTDMDLELRGRYWQNRVGFVPGELPRAYFLDEADVDGEGDPGVADRELRISVAAEMGEGVTFDGYMGIGAVDSGAGRVWHYLEENLGIEEEDLNTFQEIARRGPGGVAWPLTGVTLDENGDGLIDQPRDVAGVMQFSLMIPAGETVSLGFDYVGGSLRNASFPIYVPEPASVFLLSVGLVFGLFHFGRVKG